MNNLFKQIVENKKGNVGIEIRFKGSHLSKCLITNSWDWLHVLPILKATAKDVNQNKKLFLIDTN